MGQKANIAAILARVSTKDQRELSLDSQVERTKGKLESQGYVVPPELVFQMDWSSLDLYSCPQFQALQRCIQGGQIAALGLLDRDRLEAKGRQRLVFLADCKEAGVEVITCQGPPMIEGPEGELVELALAIGKERSVLRAQQGSRDGLADRATIKRLPPSPRNPYGYAWTKDRTRLECTSDWPIAEMICRMSLEGATLGDIRRELHMRGVPTPNGQEWWAKQVISGLVTNPIYGGRFYALRRQEVEPKHRRVEGYGKTSSRRKPLEEALYLSNIIVENPPLTWEEWESLQQRLHRNKLLARRNGKRDYLLRGLITCETHRRRYHGQPRRRTWYYVCSAGYEPGAAHCLTSYIHGPELEDRVKAICRDVLTKPEILDAEVAKRSNQSRDTMETIKKKLDALDKKESKALATETQLVMAKATGDASPEAYDRALSLIRAEKTWITEERERLQTELTASQEQQNLIIGLSQIRERLCSLLDRATTEDWREIFTALALELRVGEEGQVEVKLAIPVDQALIESCSPEHD